MVNIELRLLSLMMKTGDFSPVQQEEITLDHMTTEQGKILFRFVTSYRAETEGAARYPSLSIARSRFERTAVDIPDPDEGDTLEALVHETQTQTMRARIQDIALELDDLAKSPEPLLEALIKKQSELRKMTDKLQVSKHISLKDGLNTLVTEYIEGNVVPDGIPWMWPSMQRATRGMQRGDFIIIAGRPKSRKSFTAFAVGAHAVRHNHSRVLIFSPEMKRKIVLLRSVASFCGLRYTELKDSSLDQLEEARLYEALMQYGRRSEGKNGETDEEYGFRLHSSIPDLPEKALPSLDILESTGRTVSWMESQIELYSPDIVIADSFYRQVADGAKRNDIDHKVMAMLSRSMKDLAMRMNVVIIGTHQLNREAEHKVGSLANLGYSDAFGQDMDMGFRVITGTMNGDPVSALVVLGGREFPFDGVLINNVPCVDFSERGPIKNRKMVEDLLKQEDQDDAEEEAREHRETAAGPEATKRRSQIVKSAERARGSIRRLSDE